MAMTLNQEFEKAAENVKQLNEAPKDDDLLQIYALYKQSIVGDNETAKPGMFNFKDKAKWEAWNGVKGLAKDDAKRQYIERVQKLINLHGLKQ